MTTAFTTTPHEIADEHRADADRALDVLLDGALEPIVDMVLTHRDGRYEALAATGRVVFERTPDGGFVELEQRGTNPLADQSTDKWNPLATEQAAPSPHRAEVPSGPADDDVSGEHPPFGDPDRFA